MRKLAVVILIVALGAVCGAKRPVVHKDADFNGKRVRQEAAVLILPERIDVQGPVVPDLVANFDGDPGRSVQLLRDTLTDILFGRGLCNLKADEFGASGQSEFNFRAVESPAQRESLLACLEISRDEYGVARATATAPDRLDSLLAAAGATCLVLIDQLKLDRVATDRGSAVTGPYLSMEAELTGQVLIWSSRSQSCVYNAYITGMRATKQVNEKAIQELACAFVRDLYQALW